MVQRMTYMCIAILSLLFVTMDAEAARGGGGGRGGGGRGGGFGGGGAGRSMNRSPSMSRSISRPSTNRSVANRSSGNIQSFDRGKAASQLSSRPRQDGRIGDGAQSQTRQQVQNFMKQSESGAHQIAKDRPGTRDAFNKLDQRDNHLLQNRPKTQEFRQSAGNNIRDRIDRNDIRDRIDHHWNHWDNHHDWWRHTGWSDLALWGPWGWGEPYYYDYYGGVPYVYSESTGQYTQAPATGGYQQQQQQIKSQTADAPSTQQEWKPLGTFALSKDGMAASDPNLYLHLSMSKEGDLQGKLLNLITRSEKDVAGIVDPKSQLAAWKMVGDADTPIMETGIYNLTKSETPVQVNFADGRRQNMLMVRVDEKNAG